MSLLLVFLGGGAGSALRYLVGVMTAERLGEFTATSGWPWATFLVNLTGCCAMGLCFRLLPSPELGAGGQARLLLMTGVLGGFTTFSAFALDSAILWTRQDGWGLVLYLLGTLGGTLAGVAIGLALGQALRP